jgi:DNA-binding MarR family transcriptional regulator
MIDSKDGVDPEEDRGHRSDQTAPAPRDGIDDIARRLDELLRAMADVSPPAAGPVLVEAEKLAAARRAFRNRRERERLFGQALFTDPSWDVLLDLFIARKEGREVTVFSACQATAVPEETVLRCITHLVEAKLVTRRAGASDPRSIYLTLTEKARALMHDYFSRTMPGSGDADA